MAIDKTGQIALPPDLVDAVRRVAGDQAEGFVIDAVRREIQRRDQVAAIREAAGAWKAHDEIPDTIDGLVDFMRRMRASEERFPQ